ncbi:ROK family protein [Saxibacter everestensis]|uniref:ROK family protein n=1 Tax=Saxibacter everestensis TaxID=2909229 RepID=A0ABY8QR97_9MICO|nr:ROK family protein [Brevibacteriaceae bacterium ZFBP1038]
MKSILLGVDVGGTTTQVVACTQDLVVIDRESVRTPARTGGSAMMDAITDLIALLLNRNRATASAIGVGAAGVVDQRTGAVLVASDSFVDWAGTQVATELSVRFDAGTVLENDVNAFVAGEVAVGAARGCGQVFGMTLGTGVGGSLMVDGMLWQGAHGAAGEIGHTPGFGDLPCTCGGKGHLETIASGRSIARRYERLTARAEGVSAAEVAALARTGDGVAGEIFADAGAAVGRGVLMVAGLLDVDTVVVGGGVSQAWDLLEPTLSRELREEPPVSGAKIRVLRGELGTDAVALGAASLAASKFLATSEGRASSR